MFDRVDTAFVDSDSVTRELFAVTSSQLCRSIATKDDIVTPGFQRERESSTFGSTADDGDSRALCFPAVTVRTVMRTDAEAFLQAADIWQLILDAARQEHRSRIQTLAIKQRDMEAFGLQPNVDDFYMALLDPVTVELEASKSQKVDRRCTVPREKAVERLR
jgi:hypothetical protein